MLRQITNKKELADYFYSYESKVYSGCMSNYRYNDMADSYTYRDVVDYCEGKPMLFAFDGGYLLLTKNEVVDLASVKPVPLVVIVKIKNILKEIFKRKEFEVRCMISTSEKLIKRLIKRKEVCVIFKYDDGSGFIDYRLKFQKDRQDEK